MPGRSYIVHLLTLPDPGGNALTTHSEEMDAG